MTSAYLVPAVLAGERVVLEDVRVGEAVQVHVHQRQAHHVGRDVVALEVLRQAAFFVRRQQVAFGGGNLRRMKRRFVAIFASVRFDPFR